MLKLNQLIGFGVRGNAVNAVNYDGSAAFLERLTYFSGPTSGEGVVSFWFNVTASTGTDSLFKFVTAFVNFNCRLENQDNALATLQFTLNSNPNLMSLSTGAYGVAYNGTGWHHVLFSYDVSVPFASRRLQVYLDNVSVANIAVNEGNGLTLNFDGTSSGISSVATHGLDRFQGDIAEFYYAPGYSLDLSVASNREKFIIGGKPANLGVDGSLPRGSAPMIYLPNPAATVNVNAGTGGNFTINGTPTVASTSPSD